MRRPDGRPAIVSRARCAVSETAPHHRDGPQISGRCVLSGRSGVRARVALRNADRILMQTFAFEYVRAGTLAHTHLEVLIVQASAFARPTAGGRLIRITRRFELYGWFRSAGDLSAWCVC